MLRAKPTATADSLRVVLGLVHRKYGLDSREAHDANEAFSILGDPRLRIKYDAGEPVSVRPGVWHTRKRGYR
jgi:hypothetical protein